MATFKDIINLTPHAVNIKFISGCTVTVQPEEGYGPLRTKEEVTPLENVIFELGDNPKFADQGVADREEIPASRYRSGNCNNVPATRAGTFYIVSGQAKAADNVKGRQDVGSPGDCIRNDKGHVVALIEIKQEVE